MKLKTKVNVNGEGLYNEIGIGEMLAIAPLDNGSLQFSAVYKQLNGTIVKSIPKTYTAEQVQDLYLLIKDDLTPNLNGVLSIGEQVYLAFRIEMAATFGISVNDIEIINE